MKTKLFILFILTILVLSFTSAICQDSVNTYLTFTDYADQKTIEVTQGDLVRLTAVAYSYNGPLWYEKLEIVGVQNIYTLNNPGTDQGYFYLFTNFHTLGTSHLPKGTYILRFTASAYNDCSTEYSELTLVIKEKIIPEEPDTQCPLVNILSPENKTYSDWINNSIFTVNENIKLESCYYVLNGQSYEIPNCINGTNYLSDIVTREGSNVLTVYATDNSSNTCSDSVTFNIQIPEEPDTQCPKVTMISPTNGATYQEPLSQASFNIEEENELGTCEYTLNGITNSFDCKKGSNTIPITTKEGSNTLTIYVEDNSTNVCPLTTNFNIQIPEEPDTQCPLVDITYPENKTYSELVSMATYEVNENRELSSCRYILNGQEFSIPNCINGSNLIDGLNSREGINSLEIFAKDSSGNECSDKVIFRVNTTIPEEPDTQCPLVNILSPENKTYSDWINNSIFTVNENIKLESCYYVLNGQSYEIPNCINGTNYLSDIVTREGSNTLTVYATDNSSNTCSDSVTFNINISEPPEEDNECPLINIEYPLEGSIYKTLISLARYTLEDESDLESCYYILNGNISDRYECSKGLNTLRNLITKEGINTLTIFARDEFMNECSASVSFRIKLENGDENKTCETCCVEPDYYDYYYEENKTIPNHYWKGDEKINLNEIELKFNPLSFFERFINRFLGILGIDPINF